LSFDSDTALEPAGEAGVWEGTVAEGWDTPRGPLGGYVMAIVMRGLELAVDDADRQARSVTMHFLRAPKAGPVTVRAQVERTGRSLTSVSGRLEQDGETLGLVLGAYSKPWASPLLDDSPMPQVAPPEPPDAPQENLSGRRRPNFVERLVMQHRFGEPPFTGADHGEAGGWLGVRGESSIDALAIAVIADAWFPAPWPRLIALAPAPTIDLTIHFRSPLPVEADLLLGRFTSRLVRDGFFEEDGELWAPDGTLVAQSRQLGLLLGAEVPA
jgi:acyl-coenzyme A thioesterase PaaI-like protein